MREREAQAKTVHGKEGGGSRRQFFNRILTGVGGVIGVGVGVPLAGFGILPALEEEALEWARLGPVEMFVTGEPKLVPFTHVVPKPWPEEPVRHAVYVLKRAETDFAVYDIRCTHVGCPVNWNPQAKRFFSPCHGGVFDIEGRVQAGPPPRPLDRYEVKIENDILYAGRLYRVDESLRRTA